MSLLSVLHLCWQGGLLLASKFAAAAAAAAAVAVVASAEAAAAAAAAAAVTSPLLWLLCCCSVLLLVCQILRRLSSCSVGCVVGLTLAAFECDCAHGCAVWVGVGFIWLLKLVWLRWFCFGVDFVWLYTWVGVVRLVHCWVWL